MKNKLLILVCVLSYILLLSSCSKNSLGEDVTYWANRSYCLELNVKNGNASLYDIYSSGKYVILNTTKYSINGNIIKFTPALSYNYAGDRRILQEYTGGEFNDIKTSLTIIGTSTNSIHSPVEVKDLVTTLSKTSIAPHSSVSE